MKRILLLVGTLLVSMITSLKFITIDTAPQDGIKRLLWSANVSGVEVMVLDKPTNRKTHLSVAAEFAEELELTTNLLYCDGKLLSVAGSTADIVEKWKSLGSDVLVELSVNSGSIDVKCILGEAGNVRKVLERVSETFKSVDKTATADSIIELLNTDTDFSVGQDIDGHLFLNTEKFSDLVGYTSDQKKFHNFKTNNNPPILVGTLPSYNLFTRLTNYAPGVFDLGMVHDRNVKKKRIQKGLEYRPFSYMAPAYDMERPMSLHEHYKAIEKEGNLPTIVTALYIKEDVPFLDMVIERYRALVWSLQSRVFLIFNRLSHRDHVVNEFIEGFTLAKRCKAFRFYNSSSEEVKTNRAMHETANAACKEFNCSWIWHQDSNVLVVSNEAIRKLMLFNVSVSSSLIVSDMNDDNPSVNFWGDTVANGFYKRSPDFFDISKQVVVGLFAVPYVSGAFLVKAEVMDDLSFHHKSYKDEDSDIVFCNSVRKSGHLFFLNTESVDMNFINGRTNESVAYPMFEHVPENKLAFYLSFYMKWDHYKQRDWGWKTASPVNNPCDDVYTMELFTNRFANTMKLAAQASDQWAFRAWTKGWDKLQTLLLEDLGYAKAWEFFSTDYMPTVAHRKFNGFESTGHPLSAFFTRMTNSSEPSDSLQGMGVYTVLVALSEEQGQLFFNDICKVSPKVGDVLIFPSRLSTFVRFVPPKSGTMMNIVSFYQ